MNMDFSNQKKSFKNGRQVLQKYRVSTRDHIEIYTLRYVQDSVS